MAVAMATAVRADHIAMAIVTSGISAALVSGRITPDWELPEECPEHETPAEYCWIIVDQP